jgi:hypothetical protein
MTDTHKEYHFTDEQIDQLLRLARGKAFQVRLTQLEWLWNPNPEDQDYDYNELANQIEDQIVNHPTNS